MQVCTEPRGPHLVSGYESCLNHEVVNLEAQGKSHGPPIVAPEHTE